MALKNPALSDGGRDRGRGEEGGGGQNPSVGQRRNACRSVQLRPPQTLCLTLYLQLWQWTDLRIDQSVLSQPPASRCEHHKLQLHHPDTIEAPTAKNTIHSQVTIIGQSLHLVYTKIGRLVRLHMQTLSSFWRFLLKWKDMHTHHIINTNLYLHPQISTITPTLPIGISKTNLTVCIIYMCITHKHV